MTKDDYKQQDKQPEEDYVEGCHKENYMKPHVCPIATGGWCKDYVRCKNMAGKFIIKKILPEYFKDVCSGKKTFEIRKDEDNANVGDILILKEWDGERFTGKQAIKQISYVLRNVPGYGLKEGYCILGWNDVDWIPVEDISKEVTEYILLSFENFTIPIVGRYEEDENGGAFYAGDEDETLVSQGMFVNAWRPLPKNYRKEEV